MSERKIIEVKCDLCGTRDPEPDASRVMRVALGIWVMHKRGDDRPDRPYPFGSDSPTASGDLCNVCQQKPLAEIFDELIELRLEDEAQELR